MGAVPRLALQSAEGQSIRADVPAQLASQAEREVQPEKRKARAGNAAAAPKINYACNAAASQQRFVSSKLLDTYANEMS